MPSPDYLPLAYDLPAVYQEDQESFDQLDSFLGLADTLLRDHLTDLAEAEQWLSPDGLRMWPPGIEVDAPWAQVRDAHLAAQQELAAWTGFEIPATWRISPEGLAQRRTYLLRAARIWRRRATPEGLVSWFRLAFADALQGSVPDLVEHFRVVDPTPTADADVATLAEMDPWLRATMFVRGGGAFGSLTRRRQAVAFVDRYAPAHVLVRVCWVDPDPGEFSLPEPPGPDDTQPTVATWQQEMRAILCSLVSFVDHAHGIRIWTCAGQGEAQDQLGVGALPGAGTTPPDE
jgi:hypothetical protein